jgi:O-antigen/teichoic acid export membrane protein
MNAINKIQQSKYLGFILGPLLSSLIAMLTIPMITWLVNPQEYGKTAIFFIVQLLLNSILYLGMDHSYVREYHEAEDKGKLLLKCFSLPFILSISFLFFIIIFKNEINNYLFLGESIWLVYLFSIWLPFLVIERFILLTLRMKGQGKEFANINVSIKILIFILTLITLIFVNNNFEMIIFSTIVGQLVVDLFLLVKLVNKNNQVTYLKYLIDFKGLKPLLAYGIPFIPFSLVIWLLNSTDRYFLSRFSTLKELGEYLAALKIVGLILIFQSIFTTLWLPTAFKWEKQKVSNNKFETMNSLVCFCMVTIYLIIITLQPIIPNLVPSDYKNIVSYLPFLLLYPVFYTISESTGLGIAFKRRSNLNLWIALLVSIINISLCYILTKTFSALGASISIGLSYFIYFVFKTTVSRFVWYRFNINYLFLNSMFIIVVATINIIKLNFNTLWLNITILILYMLLNYKYITEKAKNIKK